MRRALPSLVLLAFSGVAPGAESVAEPADEFFKLFYKVEASTRSVGATAELRAAANLLMKGRRSADGNLILELERPLTPAWKLYFVDPLGPLGDEVKLAAVVSLPEAGWSALEDARLEAERLGVRQYEKWSSESAHAHGHGYDGSFAFVVIGDPRNRFLVDIAGNGQVKAVQNRLTDRWLSGPFDQWIGAWGRDVQVDGPQGYWFWNQGESAPFDYEPHTYHALETALALLRYPLVPLDVTRADFRWKDFAQRAANVFERLVPKATGKFPHTPDPQIQVNREEHDDGSVVLHGTPAPSTAASTLGFLNLERRLQLSPAGPISDELTVELTSRRGHLKLHLGYRSTTQITTNKGLDLGRTNPAN